MAGEPLVRGRADLGQPGTGGWSRTTGASRPCTGEDPRRPFGEDHSQLRRGSVRQIMAALRPLNTGAHPRQRPYHDRPYPALGGTRPHPRPAIPQSNSLTAERTLHIAVMTAARFLQDPRRNEHPIPASQTRAAGQPAMAAAVLRHVQGGAYRRSCQLNSNSLSK